MRPGDEVIATFPGALGYGPEGRRPRIPPNAALRFRIVLLGVPGAGRTAGASAGQRRVSEIAATLDILTRLIAFDTTSRNSNLALIEWVEEFLAKRGVIASQRVANADGSKANLYALIGPEVEGGVVLSGHTDVVPVDGQPWSSDPWLRRPSATANSMAAASRT